MRTNNQYHHFKAVQNTFPRFFHSRFYERSRLFAFIQSLTMDYLTEFIDLKIPQLEFDKTLFYDHPKTRKNKQTIMVHKGKDKFPFLTLTFKLLQLIKFIFLNLRDFELYSSNPFWIIDKSSSNQK